MDLAPVAAADRADLRGVSLLWAWALACAGPQPVRGPVTEQGRFRVAFEARADGWRAWIGDAAGRPEEHALVEVAVRDGAGGPLALWVADPGECDDIGPERCFHPGGRYEGRGAWPAAAAAVELTVRGAAGTDRLWVPLTPAR